MKHIRRDAEPYFADKAGGRRHDFLNEKGGSRRSGQRILGNLVMVDSRTTGRHPIDLPARLRIGESDLSCRIRNLSLGGVFVIGPTLAIGTRCRLRFKAPGIDAFDAWCIARWHTAEGTGLKFEQLQPMDTHRLSRFLRSASRDTMRLIPVTVLRPPAR